MGRKTHHARVWGGGAHALGGEQVPPREHTHPVPPRRPGSAGQMAGLEDESKWQVFKALKKMARENSDRAT